MNYSTMVLGKLAHYLEEKKKNLQVRFSPQTTQQNKFQLMLSSAMQKIKSSKIGGASVDGDWQMEVRE